MGLNKLVESCLEVQSVLLVDLIKQVIDVLQQTFETKSPCLTLREVFGGGAEV